MNASSLKVEAKLDPIHQQVAVCDEEINCKPYSVTRMLIKSRPEQVWQVLTDYASAPRVFPTLKKCQVLSDNGCTKRVHYQIRPSGVVTCFEYDLDMRETPHKMIEWKRASGDFKDLEGFWKLEPAEGGHSTIVTYASHVNGGFLMPQALIRRQSRIDFPVVMTALKSTAENTTQIAARAGHSHQAN
jgi:ribosome-associated toxin RatA of RatAB toxin-antitoxin module